MLLLCLWLLSLRLCLLLLRCLCDGQSGRRGRDLRRRRRNGSLLLLLLLLRLLHWYGLLLCRLLLLLLLNRRCLWLLLRFGRRLLRLRRIDGSRIRLCWLRRLRRLR